MPKLMSKAKFKQIVELLEAGEHTFVSAGHLADVTATAVRKIAQGRHFYQVSAEEQRRRQAKRTDQLTKRRYYLPTVEDIAAACERIQAERRRAASEDDPDAWMPPVISMRDLIGV